MRRILTAILSLATLASALQARTVTDRFGNVFTEELPLR